MRASTIEIYEVEYQLQGRSCERAYPGDTHTTHSTHHISADTAAVDAGRRPLGRGFSGLYPGHRADAIGARPAEKIEVQTRHRSLPTRPTLECSTLRKNTMRTFHVGSVKVTKFERAYPVAAYPGDDFLLREIPLGYVCKSDGAYPGSAPTG